jgi:hypothetical protein
MICTKCKIEKDNSLFRVRLKTKLGLHYWCRDCENKANKKRYIVKPKNIKTPKEAYLIKLDRLKRMLKYRYSITYEQYIAMYENQNNSCKICKISNILGGKRGLQVDHCHKTNKIRGLICPACNRGMIFIDKINDISIIINYKK